MSIVKRKMTCVALSTQRGKANKRKDRDSFAVTTSLREVSGGG